MVKKKKTSKKKVNYNNKTIVIGVIVLVILFVFAFAYQGSRDDEEGLGNIFWWDDDNGDEDMDGDEDMEDEEYSSKMGLGGPCKEDGDCKSNYVCVPLFEEDGVEYYGKCVECRDDLSCKNKNSEKPFCDKSGSIWTCEKCKKGENVDSCKGNPAGPHCDFRNECVECFPHPKLDGSSYNHCKNNPNGDVCISVYPPSNPTSKSFTVRCGCKHSVDCKEGYYCQKDENKCKKRDCVNDANCVNPKFPYCVGVQVSSYPKITRNLCAVCSDPSHCPGNPEEKECFYPEVGPPYCLGIA